MFHIKSEGMLGIKREVDNFLKGMVMYMVDIKTEGDNLFLALGGKFFGIKSEVGNFLSGIFIHNDDGAFAWDFMLYRRWRGF